MFNKDEADFLKSVTDLLHYVDQYRKTVCHKTFASPNWETINPKTLYCTIISNPH